MKTSALYIVLSATCFMLLLIAASLDVVTLLAVTPIGPLLLFGIRRLV